MKLSLRSTPCKLDAAGEIAESDESNNQLAFTTGMLLGFDGTIYVYGTPNADSFGLQYDEVNDRIGGTIPDGDSGEGNSGDTNR